MSFTQMITFRTDDIAEVRAIRDRWMTASGSDRKATHAAVYRVRDGSNRYVQLVSFPSYEEAQQNSDLEATNTWAEEMGAVVDDMEFVDLDLVEAVDL